MQSKYSRRLYLYIQSKSTFYNLQFHNINWFSFASLGAQKQKSEDIMNLPLHPEAKEMRRCDWFGSKGALCDDPFPQMMWLTKTV